MWMEPGLSEVRRRARYHALRGGPPAQVGEGVARTRRFMVLIFQVVVLAFLALARFPAARLLVTRRDLPLLLAACRYPAGPVTERIKMRVLSFGLLSYGAWLANTGGLCSPLLPMASACSCRRC